MPAKHFIDNEAKLLITIWEGEVTDANLLQALKEYQKTTQCKPEYVDYNEIFDLSNAEKVKVTINGMINIGHTASSTDHLFTHKKLAFIVKSNIAFSLARMYEVYRNMGISSCKKIRVFKHKDQAIEWAKTALLKAS